MRKKVGILGGTFNPIHLGHIQLALSAYEQLSLDKVIFMPSGCSYMKRNMNVLPAKTRLELIHLSIKDYPFFESSDMEITRGGNTYTFETLEILKKQEPETDFYFILGADCLYSIENWVNPDRIFKACTIVAAVRDNKVINDLVFKDLDIEDLKTQADLLRQKFHAQIILLKFEKIAISSSQIRQRCKEGASIQGMVHPQVETFISANKLFVQ